MLSGFLAIITVVLIFLAAGFLYKKWYERSPKAWACVRRFLDVVKKGKSQIVYTTQEGTWKLYITGPLDEGIVELIVYLHEGGIDGFHIYDLIEDKLQNGIYFGYDVDNPWFFVPDLDLEEHGRVRRELVQRLCKEAFARSFKTPANRRYFEVDFMQREGKREWLDWGTWKSFLSVFKNS